MPDAGLFRTHDLRRGHTLDMEENGATKCEIMLGGQWRSQKAMVMHYLDTTKLEADAGLEARLNDKPGASSSEDSDSDFPE